MALAPDSRLGVYDIQALVGAGGMGEVYRARDARLGRDVAVKVLPVAFASDPERLARFEQEARAAAALNHPNVTAVFDVGVHEGAPYLVSELLQGESLRTRLSSAPLPVRRAIDYATQIAHGLAAAHGKGITHRDLKPDNVFICSDGRVKILDFGLAKLTAANPDGATVTRLATTGPDTQPGLVLGTMGYMAPEQVRGLPIDHRADIFAFGAVLYEMLTGERAFRGATAADTMAAILNLDPPPLSRTDRTIAPALTRIVDRCLEKDPHRRFQSAEDLAFALDALSSMSAPDTGSVAVAPHARRIPLPVGVIAGIVLGAALVGAWFARRPAAITSPTFTQVTFQRGIVDGARFTPDGQSVVYSAAWNGRPYEAFSVRVDNPESRPLGFGPAQVLGVSTAGDVALALRPVLYAGIFGWRGTLASAPVVGGASRVLAEYVTAADWSPDGRELAIISTPAPDASQPTSRVEYPVGTAVFEVPRPQWLSHVRVSPDGNRVAFAHHPIGGADDGEVVVVDRNGTRVTASGGWTTVQGIAWNRQANEVWFTAARGGGLRMLQALNLQGAVRIVLAMPTTSTLQDVTSTGRVLMASGTQLGEIRGVLPMQSAEETLSAYDWPTQPFLSADGSTLVFNESGEATRRSGYGVFMRQAGSPFPVRLGPEEGGMSPKLSPDGRWVSTAADSGHVLTLLPTGAGQPRRLPSGAVDRYTAVDWFPDGRRLLVTALEKGAGETRSFVQDVDGGLPVALKRRGFLPSPDGLRYVCRDAGAVGICRLDADTFVAIPDGSDLRAPVRWSADGEGLIMFELFADRVLIFHVNVRSGVRRVIRELRPSDTAGIMTLGSPAVSQDERFYAYGLSRMLSQLYVVDGVR